MRCTCWLLLFVLNFATTAPKLIWRNSISKTGFKLIVFHKLSLRLTTQVSRIVKVSLRIFQNRTTWPEAIFLHDDVRDNEFSNFPFMRSLRNCRFQQSVLYSPNQIWKIPNIISNRVFAQTRFHSWFLRYPTICDVKRISRHGTLPCVPTRYREVKSHFTSPLPTLISQSILIKTPPNFAVPF